MGNSTDMTPEQIDNHIICWDGQQWYDKKSIEAIRGFVTQMKKNTMYRILSGAVPKVKEEDNLKWAWVMIGKTKKMCWVDNKTMKAYKADRYAQTNIEIKHFTFLRWCTSFDL